MGVAGDVEDLCCYLARAGIKRLRHPDPPAIADAALAAGVSVEAFSGPNLVWPDVWQAIWWQEPSLPLAVVQTAPGGTVFVLRAETTLPDAHGLYPLTDFAGASAINLLVKRRRIDVIIPVFNAPKETLACIRSLAADVSVDEFLDVRYIMIDDASTDPAIKQIIAEHLPEGWLAVENERNQGFPKTVNRGFGFDPQADVVIINSDTEIPEACISKLARAAGHDDMIATVTPASNNASIYSWPRYQVHIGDIRRALQHPRTDLWPLQVPVGVGYCMYIRRRALQITGGFDEVFGRGYGEETDFCLQTKSQGMKHIFDPTQYVLHHGGSSMTEVLGDLRSGNTYAPNESIIKRRYPEFATEVHHFRHGVLSAMHEDMDTALMCDLAESRRHVMILSPKFQTAHLQDAFLLTTMAANGCGGWRLNFGAGLADLAYDVLSLPNCLRWEELLEAMNPDILYAPNASDFPEPLLLAAERHGVPVTSFSPPESVHAEQLAKHFNSYPNQGLRPQMERLKGHHRRRDAHPKVLTNDDLIGLLGTSKTAMVFAFFFRLALRLREVGFQRTLARPLKKWIYKRTGLVLNFPKSSKR